MRNGNTNNSCSNSYKNYASNINKLTAAIDAKDHCTFDHSRAVATYAVELGKRIGLDDEHLRIVKEAGLLHDIGKIAIPEEILSKSGKLTSEEYAVMKTHVEYSIEIIKYLPELDYLIPAIVCHHEAYNGTGYPRGISGENIPIDARCLSVADSFDAIISKRSYKEAYSYEYAEQELESQAGRQFDPNLAAVFVDMIKDGTIYPNMPKVI